MTAVASLAVSALLLGLASAPHCVAMCGPACGAITGGPVHQGLPVVSFSAAPPGPAPVGVLDRSSAPGRASAILHAGRLLGYATAGAAVASAFHALAWLSTSVAALRPVWLLMHAAVLAWGLLMIASGRQPVWSLPAVSKVVQRLRQARRPGPGLFLLGTGWALMPCGMLYSALLLAALAGDALGGAAVMVLFAMGGTAALVAAPWLWRWTRARFGRWGDATATRVAGLLLTAVAGRALWIDLQAEVGRWCA